MDVRLRLRRPLALRAGHPGRTVAVYPVGACGQQTGVLGREELICNYPGTTERKKKTICHNLTLAGAAARRKQSTMKAYYNMHMLQW